MSIITLAEPRLSGTGKKGIIKPDENGYYETLLGALDVRNGIGEIYPYNGNEDILKDGSPLKRRIKNGHLFAEMGHPKREPGMTDHEWLVRYSRIEETKHCAHISNVWLDTEYVSPDGLKMVGIVGKVKPAGPYKETIEEYMKTPSVNTAWSVRSFTRNIRSSDGNVYKYFVDIRTWDFVSEPGISVATKWDSPAVEEMVDDMVISDRIIVNIGQLNNDNKLGLTSEDSEVLDNLRSALKETYGSGSLTRAWNRF